MDDLLEKVEVLKGFYVESPQICGDAAVPESNVLQIWNGIGSPADWSLKPRLTIAQTVAGEGDSLPSSSDSNSVSAIMEGQAVFTVFRWLESTESKRKLLKFYILREMFNQEWLHKYSMRKTGFPSSSIALAYPIPSFHKFPSRQDIEKVIAQRFIKKSTRGDLVHLFF
jgi:hypothetical protein